MKPFTQASWSSSLWSRGVRLLGGGVIGLMSFGCLARQHGQPPTHPTPAPITISDDGAHPRPPFRFAPSDAALLDEIQHASFQLFWHGVSPDTGMVYDRTSSDVISIAGVGFQLAAIPIGVERGWITRDAGEQRTLQILRALEGEPSNRKAGLFYHFLEPHDASARRVGAEMVVSTIDSAIAYAGMLSAGVYFDGESRLIADRLFASADWSFFLQTPGDNGPPGRFMSLGWRPEADSDPTGAGELIGYSWIDSGDEHRLVTFMGVAATDASHRVPAKTYFALRRQIGNHPETGDMVWFPYSGALFTAFFAHCFIDYAHLGADDPSSMVSLPRPAVDWWENSRRVVNLHRARALENPEGVPTLGPNAWGLSACDSPGGYLVAGVFPDRVETPGLVQGRDFSSYVPSPRWGDGTVPPYAAGASIMFEPEASLAALRWFRELTDDNGAPLLWRDPGHGGFGLPDAFNLRSEGEAPWVASDTVAIDHGPMLLGIENARTGLIWSLFSRHPAVQAAESRLGLRDRE